MARLGLDAERGERGFTLLELLISFTLLSGMLLTTYGMFWGAIRMVPVGEAQAERSARLRAASDLISRQIRSIVNYSARGEGEVFPYFWGDSYSCGFVTAAPQHNGGEGLGWVIYWTDGQSLSLGERVIFSSRAIAEGSPEDEEASQAVVLDGFESAYFQYLRLDGNDVEWRSTWDGREEQGIPAAIRITIGGLGLGESYWVQEIPVMTVAYGLGAFDPDARPDDLQPDDDQDDDVDNEGDS